MFGFPFAVFDGFNENGFKEIAIGSEFDDDGYTDAGAIYIMGLNVIHKPIARAGLDQLICEGDVATLDASFSSVPDNDPLTYKWSCTNYEINKDTSQLIDFIAPKVETTSKFEFILKVQCEGVFSEADTVEITVLPQPEKPVLSQELNRLSTNDAASFQWYFSGTMIPDAIEKEYVATQNGNYQVAAFSAMGCLSELSDEVEVNIKPTAHAKAIRDVCSGEVLTLDGSQSSAPISGALSYKWTCEQVVLPDTDTVKLDLDLPASTVQSELTFYLEVTLPNFGTSTDTIYVSPYPVPQPPEITMEGTTLSTSEAAAFQWYLEGEKIAGATNQMLTIMQNGNYQVEVFTEQGCSRLSSNFRAIVVPVAQAKAQQNICSGTLLSLDGSESSSPIAGELSYHWSGNYIEVTDSNNIKPSFITPKVSEPTVYEFYLVVSRNELSSPADTVSVTINPAPQQPIIQQFADTLKCDAATYYQWYLEELEITNAVEQIYVIGQSGNYYVKVINEYGCVSDPSPKLHITKTGKEQLGYEALVYPNPVENRIQVWGLPANKQTLIKIHDVNGKTVLQTTVNTNGAELNLSQLPKGVYFLSLNNNIEQKIKLLKE